MSDERKRVTVSVTLEYADDGMNIYDAVLFEIQQAESIQIPFPDGTGEVAIIKEYPNSRAETVITVGDWPPADAHADPLPTHSRCRCTPLEPVEFRQYPPWRPAAGEADVESELREELARVQAERDAAVGWLKLYFRGEMTSRERAKLSDWLDAYDAQRTSKPDGAQEGE